MYDEFTLSNGLRVIAEKIPHFRSVSVGLWIGTGSMLETREENGLSHFIEHMLFKGTQQRSAMQIAEEMDAIGGQVNAFTSKECTCYYAKVIDEHFEKALDLLSDMLLHATFNLQDLEKERSVILEEIAMTEDTPEDLVYELLSEAYFGDHALARPILGPAEVIRSVTREQILAFHRRHYRPDNTVLAVAGGYELDQLRELAGRYLGAWAAPAQAQKAESFAGCAQQVRIKRKDIEQVHVCLGYEGIATGADEAYPMAVFNNIFGGGMSSRLFQKIREEMGAAYSVYSYPTSYPDCGVYAIYAGTSIQQAQQVVDEIRRQVDRFLADGFTDREFTQARDQLKGGYILGLESTSSRMSALGRSKLLLGYANEIDEVIRRIERVTPQDVMSVARRILESPFAAAAVGRGVEALKLQ
ncbi:MAG TPA: insulinase family protein [Candidatus Onthenecus intestinigallinarum]|uniref:Insulinase family protein n=1 Tax=Candidatus Onthenecus intestinigallinarum TaxID=2840875 RepID=A0A9D0ZAY5_9FIRM|nr:insulinase family protein [Candidatus Onthenecus intestinigallinarum]